MKFDFFSKNAEALLQKYRIGLTIEEAQNLQKALNRPMTLTEAIIFGIQLSEHCSYKSSRKFLRALPTEGEGVILGPKEDAGVLEVFEHEGEKYGIAVGHESHNHPSQIVPYEGAATGVGGIIRDIMCMGARPVGVADSLRFGDLTQWKQRNIAAEVVRGIAGYGNPLGVPNVGGDMYADKDFNENCLVNVTALGVLREKDLIHSFVPPQAAEEGWEFIIVGKPTDNSGFGGASFASDTFEADDDLEAKKAAVQEPNPFLERHLIVAILDLLERYRKEGKYHLIALKDLGAGGVTCATVEMAEGGGFGADITLEHLHTAGDYPPHVIACSETQERFCFACHPSLTQEIISHFEDRWELGRIAEKAGASCIGKVRGDGLYRVTYNGEVLCEAPAKLITQGILYDRPYHLPTYKPTSHPLRYQDGKVYF